MDDSWNLGRSNEQNCEKSSQRYRNTGGRQDVNVTDTLATIHVLVNKTKTHNRDEYQRNDNIFDLYHNFIPLRRSELLTTETLEKAIANPAKTGLKSHPKIG